MASLEFRITNLDRLEAELISGLGKYASDLMDSVKLELNKFKEAVIRRVATHEDFVRLKSDSFLRGQLGMAVQGFRTGGDTDAEDLLRELQSAKLVESKAGRNRVIGLRFPSIAELSDRLMHRLTRVHEGTASGGRRESWFAWWEFGNASEVEGATLFPTSTFRTKAKYNLAEKIQQLSRSGYALQFANLPPNSKSVIRPHKVIQTVYRDFGKVLPARMGIILRGFARAKDINTYFRNT